MMASLRGRLYVGLAAIALLAGLAAGAMAFRWAYHEANEFQDAFLLQIGALAVNNRIQTGPAVEHGVDTEARVIIEELGRPALGVDASLPRLPDNIPDGLQALMRGKVSWRILVRTRPDGSRVVVSQSRDYRDEMAHDIALRAILRLPLSSPVLCC
jgi:two-component system, OmpR family, sensor kinase